MTGLVIEGVREVVWVPFPERAGEVLATAGLNFDEGAGPLVYWETDPLTRTAEVIATDHSGPAIRYVRDHEMPLWAGASAWRRHDPAHPRCWHCGRFVSPYWRGRYSPPCPDCGEPLGYW